MAEQEYARAAQRLGDHLSGLDRAEAVRAACRGSGDPAALAWLAEALDLRPGQLVVDVGGGTGGPAAWLVDHYDVRAVVVEPVTEAAEVARRSLGLLTVRATGGQLPVAGPVDAVLLLGVLSVTEERLRPLTEARRISDHLGLLVWCAAGDEPVEAGGSSFPPVAWLDELLAFSGWAPTHGPETSSLPAPETWRDVDPGERTDEPADRDEAAVARAIDDGRLVPELLVAEATELPAAGPDGLEPERCRPVG